VGWRGGKEGKTMTDKRKKETVREEERDRRTRDRQREREKDISTANGLTAEPAEERGDRAG
jgi:hypothetical protein